MGYSHARWMAFINNPQKPERVSLGLLRRVLKYANPYRALIGGMLLLILFNACLNLISPLVLRELIDHAIPEKDVSRLAVLAAALLILPVTGSGFSVLQRWLNARIGEGVIYDLRVALFTHLQRMSLRFFTHTRAGELLSRLNNDVIGAQSAISSTIVSIITNVIQTVVLLGVMLSLEWRLTLISVLIFPLFLLVARKMGGQLREIARSQMSANAQMNAMMSETLNIGGALLVKLFGRSAVETQRFEERAGLVRDLGVRRAVIGVLFFMIMGLLGAVGTALIYGIGGLYAIQGRFSIGTIVAFGFYLERLYSALQDLSDAPVEFVTSLVSFERVFEVIDLPLDIPEKEDARVLDKARGEIVFENVSFRYEDTQAPMLSDVERIGRMDSVSAVFSGKTETRPDASGEAASQTEEVSAQSQARDAALEEISFKAEPGMLVALVGPSGAGKTTLTYLIPRLYDPQEGRILLDGHDLRDLTLDSLAAQVGMVTQETYLFHDTIRTNLLYARLDAGQTDIENAARAANIHDFIAGLPDGYDTLVGERGYRLSGGEKQRIALARVILKDPRILVLDEATSHLDSESEVLIQEALKRVMAQRTSIVIAHRLSTILAADLILVLNRGRIVERGTHTSLLTKDGLYAHLYRTQYGQESASTADSG